MNFTKPKLVADAATVHKRHAVRLLLVTFALNVGASLWSMLPDAFVNRLPPSLIFAISSTLSILTVGLTYIRQDQLQGAVEEATGETDVSKIE